MRGLAVRQGEHDLIDIAPAPAFRRVITLDDRVLGGVEMLGGVLVGGIIAAPDMAARAADAKVQPYAAGLEALLAAQRARRHLANAGYMRAAYGHDRLLSSASHFPGVEHQHVGA